MLALPLSLGQAAWNTHTLVDLDSENPAKNRPKGDVSSSKSAGRWVLQRPIDKPLALPLYNVPANLPSWIAEHVPAAVWTSQRGELSVHVIVIITSLKPLRVWIDEEVRQIGEEQTLRFCTQFEFQAGRRNTMLACKVTL